MDPQRAQEREKKREEEEIRGTASEHEHPREIVRFEQAAVRRGRKLVWSHGTFAIPRGSVTAIVGTNGAGKTTLLSVELGLIPLSHGTVRVLGRKPGTLNSRIGYVPQSYATDIDANITAEQSVALGLNGSRFGFRWLTRAQRQKVQWALRLADIDKAAGLRLSEMSGGMRQRVAIAQALVADPDLLLLDEPLANLDITGQRDLVATLARLNSRLGTSIQIVAHDLNMLLPILTGAIYLIDGHPHYAPIGNVMDSKLLTHLYGTKVEVLKTPEGDMFVRPNPLEEPHGRHPHTHTAEQAAEFHAEGEDSHGHDPVECDEKPEIDASDADGSGKGRRGKTGKTDRTDSEAQE